MTRHRIEELQRIITNNFPDGDILRDMIAALDAADRTIPRKPSNPPKGYCRIMLRLKTTPWFYFFGWYNPDAVKGSQWIVEGPTNIDFCDQWIIDWLPEPKVEA